MSTLAIIVDQILPYKKIQVILYNHKLFYQINNLGNLLAIDKLCNN